MPVDRSSSHSSNDSSDRGGEVPSPRETSAGAGPVAPVAVALLVATAALVAWYGVATSGRVPPYLLPHPFDVVSRIVSLWRDGLLLGHIAITARAAFSGLAIAVGLALPVGYLVARSRWISALLMPYLVAIRAVPVVAIAALVVIWLGSGVASKVFVAAFITWFPMMEATVVGLGSADPALREMLASYRATRWQTLRYLQIPAALPNLLSGLKVSVSLAVVGAAVGELIGSSRGLAYLILFGRGTSDSALVVAAVLLLTGLSLVLYGSVALIERRLLAWRRAGHHDRGGSI